MKANSFHNGDSKNKDLSAQSSHNTSTTLSNRIATTLLCTYGLYSSSIIKEQREHFYKQHVRTCRLTSKVISRFSPKAVIL